MFETLLTLQRQVVEPCWCLVTYRTRHGHYVWARHRWGKELVDCHPFMRKRKRLKAPEKRIFLVLQNTPVEDGRPEGRPMRPLAGVIDREDAVELIPGMSVAAIRERQWRGPAADSPWTHDTSVYMLRQCKEYIRRCQPIPVRLGLFLLLLHNLACVRLMSWPD
jgi:hypothetical protein